MISLETIEKAAELATAIAAGAITAAEAAKRTASLGLDLVDADEFRGYLTDEDRRRADAIADAAQAAKFGKVPRG